jgi:Flp pilus assembly protein TadG
VKGSPGCYSVWRQSTRGQAIPLVAIGTLLLFMIVGLAIDGGSLYVERRRSQNAADGAALAGTRPMLNLYSEMIQGNWDDVDGSAAAEQEILAAIEDYAVKNGVKLNNRSHLTAYFVNDNKQVVTEVTADCGRTAPCQVGQNGSVPWTRGAKGIAVTAHTETDAFLMVIVGWNRIGATASATAYMGVTTETTEGLGLLPIGFFTDTTAIDNLVVGQTYSIINGSTRRGSGNWGYIDFNGNGNPVPVVNAWIVCGFNPAMDTQEEWTQWCPYAGHRYEYRAMGPVMYGRGTGEPLAGPHYSRRVDWNSDWWIAGSSGTTNSTCQFFDEIQDELRGKEYLIPTFDRTNGQGGNNTKFHLVALLWFRITDVDINCRPRQGQEAHWSIQGTYIQRYNAGGSGQHGDIRRTSNPVVFLQP